MAGCGFDAHLQPHFVQSLVWRSAMHVWRTKNKIDFGSRRGILTNGVKVFARMHVLREFLAAGRSSNWLGPQSPKLLMAVQIRPGLPNLW
jgi:hypothetical protein